MQIVGQLQTILGQLQMIASQKQNIVFAIKLDKILSKCRNCDTLHLQLKVGPDDHLQIFIGLRQVSALSKYLCLLYILFASALN